MRHYEAPIGGRDDPELRRLAKQHLPGFIGTNRVRKNGVVYYRVVVYDDDLTDPGPWFEAMGRPVILARPDRWWRHHPVPILAVAATAVGLAVGGVDAVDFLPLAVAAPTVVRRR